MTKVMVSTAIQRKFDESALPAVPVPVADLSVAYSDPTATLTWTYAGANELGFRIYRSDNGGNDYKAVGNAAIDAVTWDEDPPAHLTHLYYAIAPYNAQGQAAKDYDDTAVA